MEASGPLAHLLVRDHVATRDFTRRGRGDPKIRPVEARSHGAAMHRAAGDALDKTDAERAAVEFDEQELRALGSIVVLEGVDPVYPLKLESLERLSSHRKTPKLPMWLLLSVMPISDADDERRERAQVWVNDAYRKSFLGLFERYLATAGGEGKPRGSELVANIGRGPAPGELPAGDRDHTRRRGPIVDQIHHQVSRRIGFLREETRGR